MLLVEPAVMAELDRLTIEELGVPGLVLMECAAGAVVRALLASFGPAARAGGVLVVAGPGNNGGDGVAIARRLRGLDVDAQVLLIADPARVRGDAKVQLDLARAQGVPIRVIDEAADLGPDVCADAGVLVDALLGTGLDRPVTGLMASAIDAMEGAAGPVVAVDIPSGVDGATGQVHGRGVRADLTVTFAAAKRGHFIEPGRAHRGRLVVADIGIPVRRLPQVTAGGLALLGPQTLGSIPSGSRAAHKGTFGHLLVVAGSPGKAGAARLCAEAALRAGAGLVTLAIPERLPVDSLALLLPEVMVERVPGGPGGTFDATSGPALEALLETRDALAIGPGLGTDQGTVALVRALYVAAEVPTVVDADGLNALAAGGVPPLRAGGSRVLTPHPGEMARLLDTTTGALAGRRVPTARTLATDTGAVVVLKGAGTIVAEPEGGAWLNPTGNPGMGTAGSGDVLTGVLGALLARGLGVVPAASAAVFWHGLAGDLAADRAGEASLIASDISEALGPALERAARGDLQPDYSTDPPGWCPP